MKVNVEYSTEPMTVTLRFPPGRVDGNEVTLSFDEARRMRHRLNRAIDLLAGAETKAWLPPYVKEAKKGSVD